ncbi:SGNH/GDSL hydrolase family protein [Candidatus Microgenomates bacterium]|nr:SGNH/GDSL hydrolase family protein [Candidatus Microgenomates bacterium]
MSFVRHVIAKKYIRFLLALNAIFFIVSFIGNVIAVHTTATQKMTADSMFDIQRSPPMVEEGSVAGAHDEAITPTVVPKATVAPKKELAEDNTEDHKPRKDSFKIAVYGDSMVDTMGEGLPYLDKALKKKYPQVKFTLLNYGMGAQNAEDGLARFDKEYRYKNRSHPSLSTVDADIIILGSFAYNPFDPFDRDKHWLALSRLIEKAKDTHADVYVLAEIAPLRSDFGKGPAGVNWDRVTAYEHSGKIIKQLENAVGLSKNLNVILINAYEKSIITAKSEGKREYVSISDGIHPSIKGQEFMADEIAKTLVLE